MCINFDSNSLISHFIPRSGYTDDTYKGMYTAIFKNAKNKEKNNKLSIAMNTINPVLSISWVFLVCSPK